MADHGQWFTQDAAHRLFNPDLGGGALLDLGVYPISFASMVLGTPTRITAVSDQAFTGVDAQTGILLQYEGGQHAVLFTSLETRTPNWACVNGTEARIEIDGVFYSPSRFRLVTRDGEVEQFEFPHEGHGLRHQAATVGQCLRAGLTESDALPLDESVAIMETMDEIRRQIGLVYPSES
jgi:predicted dehydrogenase